MLGKIFLINKLILGMSEILTKDNNFQSSITFKALQNTVLYFTVNVNSIPSNGKSMIKVEDVSSKVKMKIFHEKDSVKEAVLDSKPLMDVTFFHTTANSGTHTAIFSLENMDSDEEVYALEIELHQGTGNAPHITSTGDVEINRADSLINGMLKFVKNFNFDYDVQFEDEVSYKGIYDGIIKKAIFLVFVKILSQTVVLIYSNLATKSFFSKQKLVQ